MSKLSPKDFTSITDWIKQFINGGSVPPVPPTPPVVTYTISINQPENGTITSNMSVAEEGDTIECTFTANEGYAVVKFFVNNVESPLIFAMPAENITLSGTTEWIIYGTLEAPIVTIVSNDETQLIYSVKNPNTVEASFNGENISPNSALELTHIWEDSEDSFNIDGYLSAEHWINSPEVTEIIDKPEPVPPTPPTPVYSEGLAFSVSKVKAGVIGIGTCTDTDIVVPPTYNDLPVTWVKYECFKNNTNITSFSSESITEIYDNCFNGCTSLTSINIPLVTSIGNQCFYDCTSLTSVNIPNVTSLSSYCFSDCTSLTSVNIPNVTSLSSYCFYDCTSLTSINIPLVTSIGDDCFSHCSKLTSIDLPLVTSIGNDCFKSCSNLTSIDLQLITSLGVNCFNGCSNLTSINIPNVTSIGNQCFYDCKKLTSINIPNVTSLGSYCFSHCSNLTSINIRTNGITPKITSRSDFIFEYLYNSTLTIHLNNTLNDETMKTNFGEYFNYNYGLNEYFPVVFDLDPLED